MRERILKVLESLLAAEKHVLESMKEERRAIKTKGTLIIRRKGKYLIFAEKIDGKEHGLARERDKIRRLARKRFLDSEIKNEEACCRQLAETITRLKSQTGRKAYDERWEQAAELREARFSAQERQWLSTAGSNNPIKPETLKYMTRAGIMVRSKSERTIADKLVEYGLPFRYEARYENCYQGCSFVTSPDFIILCADGREVIWEHFGLLSDEEYAQKNTQKLIDYLRCGCSLTRDLICTIETDIENPQVLDHIIQKFLL